jgi:cytochrome c-type biogenesis protein CcmH
VDINALRAQLQQLTLDHEQGKLSSSEHEQRRAEIERQIVAQVMAAGAGPASGPTALTAAAPTAADMDAKPSRRLWLGVASWVIVVAAAGYAWTGSPSGIGTQPPPQAAAPAPAPELAQIAAMVDKLAERLKEKPDDALGWAMLARSYSVLGRNAEALPAYAKAVELKGDDAGLLSDYAAELAMQNQRNLAGRPIELVQRALAIDPNNLKALSLAGMAAFDNKDYAGAVAQWEKILSLAPADPDLVQQVQASVAEARELGKLPPPTGTTASAAPAATTSAAAAPALGATGTAQTAAAAADAAVAGTVSLSASLAAQAAPNDTVFIIARPADGSRMPLAVLRKQVKDLPLEFRLDDSLAMSPAAKLSMHPTVLVSARVSKSGNAIAQPGDLVGAAPAPVSLGTRGLKIEIAQTVPN